MHQSFFFRYHVDPNKIVVDFSSSGDAWYDSTELNKFIATNNEITELDEKIGTEFGALTLIDVSLLKRVYYLSHTLTHNLVAMLDAEQSAIIAT